MCRKLALAATVIALSFPIAAFAQGAPAPVKASPEARRLVDAEEPLARASFWKRELQADPRDLEAGLKLSAALRAIGQYDQAAETARRVSLTHQDNVDALLEYARAKIAGGHAFDALDQLRLAAALAPRDWRPLSLHGVAFEEVNRPDDAHSAYERALILSPDNPAILSNQAMRYASRGDAARAETILRRAVALPGATVQIRQNLAYVLGIRGNLTEAERLVRADLPPEAANNNIAYLRALSAPGG